MFYPSNLHSNKWLSYYAEYFNTVELNMSFYRTPYSNIVKSWLKNTHKDFIFTVKASRFITHIKKLADINDSIKNLYQLVSKFENKCRCILFQFPPSFYSDINNLRKLKELFELLDYNYDHALEFRNESWWDNKYYHFLKGKAAFCIVDGLRMPENFVVTNNFIYIRFHGHNYNTLYSKEELQDYSKKIKNLSKEYSINYAYIYFNNDVNCYAVKNAMYLKELLNN